MTKYFSVQVLKMLHFSLIMIFMVLVRLDSFQVMDFEGLVSSLNQQGFLLKKGPKLYQLQTVWCRQLEHREYMPALVTADFNQMHFIVSSFQVYTYL